MKKIEIHSFQKPNSGFEKIHFYLGWFIRLLLLLALVLEFIGERGDLIYVTLLALFLTFMPDFFQRKYKISIPPEFQLFIVLFIYSSLYLGNVRGFYDEYWWWDTMLHTLSGFALGIVGFSILYVLMKGDKILASPFLIAFFAFCFSLAMGTLWEILEFTLDEIFDWNMQRRETGVVDTMLDLIVDAIGALFASIGGYIYLKKGRWLFIDRMIKHLIENNPKLFPKK